MRSLNQFQLRKVLTPGLGAIDKFYISNTLNGSGSSVGAIVDEITILKK